MRTPSPAPAASTWHTVHCRLQDAVSIICLKNFDPDVSNPAGNLGAGIYFTRSSVHSEWYCRQDGRYTGPSPSAGPCPSFIPGCWAMLLADVLLGNPTAGRPNAYAPPPGFHSTTRANPETFVVFERSQAYPAYVLHFNL